MHTHMIIYTRARLYVDVVIRLCLCYVNACEKGTPIRPRINIHALISGKWISIFKMPGWQRPKAF